MNGFHYATVVSNNDTELQAGRVKIRIPYLHNQVSDDDLPWAKQMCLFSGGSASHGKSDIPEEDSMVWVVFDNDTDLLKPFYIADVQLNDMNPHLLFDENVKDTIGSTASYPNVKFNYYKNGICTGVSSDPSNAEVFVYHPSGTFAIVDKDGNIKVNDTNGNTFETSATSVMINNNLEVLQ